MLAKIEDTLVISENNLDEIITNEEILRVIKIWSYKKISYFFFKRSERKNLWCRRIRK